MITCILAFCWSWTSSGPLFIIIIIIILFFFKEKKTTELYCYSYLIHLQMIESSAHGDDYDGVIFSQLVRKNYLWLPKIFPCLYLLDILVHFACFLLQNLIDLAGSESSKTETTGLRRKEGSYINKSLLTLGTVGVTKFVFVNVVVSYALFLYFIISMFLHGRSCDNFFILELTSCMTCNIFVRRYAYNWLKRNIF